MQSRRSRAHVPAMEKSGPPVLTETNTTKFDAPTPGRGFSLCNHLLKLQQYCAFYTVSTYKTCMVRKIMLQLEAIATRE